MSHRRSMFLPVSVVVASLALIAMLVQPMSDSPYAAPLQQENDSTTYAIQTATRKAEQDAKTAVAATATAAYPLTQTADAAGDEAAATDTPTDNPTDTPTDNPTENPTNTATSKPQTIQQEQATNTPTETEEPTETNAPTATKEPTRVPATPTPTPTPDPSDIVLDCTPGHTIIITGSNAPPLSALVIYFARPDILTERQEYAYQPVGGGVSDALGNFRLSVTIGEEEEFVNYYVQVRERHTLLLLQEQKCVSKEPGELDSEGDDLIGQVDEPSLAESSLVAFSKAVVRQVVLIARVRFEHMVVGRQGLFVSR